MAIKNADKLKDLDPNLRRLVELFSYEVKAKYGIDLYITSGKRTEEENRRVGGVRDSAHLKGLAVDIFAPNGFRRYLLLKAAIEFGFKRIGVGKSHIHIDIDYTKPTPTIFADCE